jgi:glycine/D-amino acid oxidase-like deaminating enzyme
MTARQPPGAPPLPGMPISLWVDTAPETDYPSMTPGLEVDVAVLGGGIAGLTAATLLKEAGKTVAVIEAGRIGTGVTGHTTGKLSSLQGLTYGRLASELGEESARVYGEANEAAIDRIERFVTESGIDCDFRRVDNHTYSGYEGDLPALREEAALARRIGLPASFVDRLDLPVPVRGAVRLTRQAQFHPVKYLQGLARTVDGDGSFVFEETEALGVRDKGPLSTVTTSHGDLRARDVVVTTNAPFLDRGLYFARAHPYRSYLLAVEVDEPMPAGMYISTEPLHSLMPFPAENVLLIGGEGHKAGQAGESADRYRALEGFARRHFHVRRVAFRWATQDMLPFDGVPLVGRYTPVSRHLYVATGFRKWGLTNGTAAAMILADRLLGRRNAWAPLFNSNRPRLAGAMRLVKENAHDIRRLVKDRFTARGPALADLEKGQGALLTVKGETVAAYRDDSGDLHAVSPRCTHLGCMLDFNDAEKTWDCPCHGSRFAHDGGVIQGPATRDLTKIELLDLRG